MNHHNKRRVGDARDWRNVAYEIVAELFEKISVDRIVHRGHQQRITVWSCSYDSLSTDIAARTRSVLYDELLAKPLPQHLADQARVQIGRATGGKADDEAHRPRRIGLRPRD